MSSARRAIFLDRDGTINVEKNYLIDPADLELIPGAATALARLQGHGYLLVVVTNQSGIGRGYFTEAQVDRLHEHLQTLLAAEGVRIDAFYLCPHHPEHTGPCRCRKGEPGMLIAAAADLEIDLPNSWMVGDKRSDIDAGESAGCRSILVATGYGSAAGALPHGTVRAADLAAAADLILERDNSR